MADVEAKLSSLGLSVPAPAASVANYLGFVRTGFLLVVSGQLCFGPDGKLAPEHVGHVGADVAPEVAKEAAKLCALNLLGQVRAAVGSLDKVARVVRLGGFISAAPDFTGHAGAMNGASDLVVELFGDEGRHARTTIGVACLPLGAAVEVEGLFEIKP